MTQFHTLIKYFPEFFHIFFSSQSNINQIDRHSALTQDELFQTLLVKTLQNDESILEMEQFSISVLNGTIKAAVVQNDVYHSENGALNYIGYGTWPHALNAAVEFEANRDRMNLEFAMMLASK